MVGRKCKADREANTGMVNMLRKRKLEDEIAVIDLVPSLETLFIQYRAYTRFKHTIRSLVITANSES